MKINTYVLSFLVVSLLGFGSVANAQLSNTFNVSLTAGSTNTTEVLKLQNYLFQAGYLKATPSGLYLSQTKQAVMDLQKALGVSPVNGFFGPLTRSAVNSKLAMSNSSQSLATIAVTSVVNANSNLAAAVLSNSKTINWQTTNYPVSAGVNINLLRKVSDSPKSFVLVRSLFVDTPNDTQETWTPLDNENGPEIYVEVTCSSTYKFTAGCKFSGEPIKAN